MSEPYRVSTVQDEIGAISPTRFLVRCETTQMTLTLGPMDEGYGLLGTAVEFGCALMNGEFKECVTKEHVTQVRTTLQSDTEEDGLTVHSFRKGS